MTHVSRKKLGKDVEKLFDEALTKLLSGLSQKEVDSVLSTVVTKTETSMLKKRLAAVILLSEGSTVDQTAKITKTTRQTITRFKYQLNEVNKNDKSFVLNKMKKWEKFKLIESFLKDISNLPISRSEFRKKISPF